MTNRRFPFRCYCATCGRGPFATTGQGKVTRHACWATLENRAAVDAAQARAVLAAEVETETATADAERAAPLSVQDVAAYRVPGWLSTPGFVPMFIVLCSLALACR